MVTRVFPVDLKLECTVIEKTLKNTSLDENVARTLQKSLYFTEIEVWLTIDNSEIDVLFEQLSASDTQHLDLPFRFDESWILTVIRVPYVGDGYIFESMKSAEIWNRGHKNKHGGMSARNFFVLRCCWASCTVGVWSTFGNIHVLNHILNGLCVEHVSHTYRDSLVYDLFNVKVFVFVRNKIHSAHMELMIVLGLYDLLSFHIIS